MEGGASTGACGHRGTRPRGPGPCGRGGERAACVLDRRGPLRGRRRGYVQSGGRRQRSGGRRRQRRGWGQRYPRPSDCRCGAARGRWTCHCPSGHTGVWLVERLQPFRRGVAGASDGRCDLCQGRGLGGPWTERHPVLSPALLPDGARAPLPLRRRRSRRLCSRCSPCGPTARKHPLAAYLPSLGLAPVAAAPAECRLPLAYRRLAACPAVLAGAPVAPPQPHQPHPSLDAAPEPERAPLSPPPRRHPAPASHAPPHARASRARRRGSPPARPPRLRLFLAALLAALLPTGQPAAACPRVQPALHPAATAARPDSLHRKVRLRPGRPHGPRGRTAARAASRLVVAPA
mmetsp:Transcript_12791/g.41813  ORF Transcript_12791/g.41813 Transcript_12791/m.41813 type:complete len:347 (+) Transcript_12791:1675-2715(+)